MPGHAQATLGCLQNVQAVEMQNAAARKVESSQQDFGKDVAGMVR